MAGEEVGHCGKLRGEGAQSQGNRNGVTLGMSLPFLGLSFLLWKCGSGLDHSKAPFGADVQGCCAIILAVVGL